MILPQSLENVNMVDLLENNVYTDSGIGKSHRIVASCFI